MIEKERADCFTHETLEETLISMDGINPGGIILTVKRKEADEEPDNIERLLTNRTIYGEGNIERCGDDDFYEIEASIDTTGMTQWGEIDANVRVATYGTEVHPTKKDDYFPISSFNTEVFLDKETGITDWHVYLGPRTDFITLKILETLMRDMDGEERKDFGYSAYSSWPRTTFEDEEVVVDFGFHKRMTIDDFDSIYTYPEPDGEGELQAKSEDICSSSSETVNGIQYTTYSVEVPFDEMFEYEGDMDISDLTVHVGIEIADIGMEELQEILDKKIRSEGLTEEYARKFMNPFLRIRKGF